MEVRLFFSLTKFILVVWYNCRKIGEILCFSVLCHGNFTLPFEVGNRKWNLPERMIINR